MKIERREPNAQELKDLKKLKKAIEQAIADGVVTKDERDRISAIMYEDGKITPQELGMLHDMVQSKVQSGDLVLDYKI